ncbi:MAG: right-handed parallel beta-helix repeat-containing protein [Butyrivibrio sp.]|uniref:right-handed parallel beta-helix repeat-containing protein n=1 Tax=Butyrivibrio sp. TaxID=28121 RepID=UPI002ED08259|nr:right-handed parallel beta-helix repeat-containing protein [Butyrivibrio sp.]
MYYYVAQNNYAGGDGSREHPFKTISEASRVALPGDEIIVSPGIYRESVDPPRGGEEGEPIIYRSSSLLGAVISGAEVVKSWKKESDNVWTLEVPNSIFPGRNPYKNFVKGDWYDVSCKAHLGDVFLNGRSMYEVFSYKEVENPVMQKTSWMPGDTLFVWYCEQSRDGLYTIFKANFRGYDPNVENVEISVRSSCFYPSHEGIGYITLSGFKICQAATNWAPPTAVQEGMVGPHWSKGWIIEDCEISESKCSGISLGKYLQPENDNKWSKTYIKDGTQTQRDAVCQAVNEGWDKETVGSHIIRRCNIHDCGQAGIVGHMGGVFSLIEDNHIHHINCKKNLAGAEIGGIKLHAAIDTVIRRNRFDHCTRGLWLDWQAQGTRVTQNLFHDNVPPVGTQIKSGLALGEDIFVEVSHGPTLIDNNILLSDIACRLSTQGIALVHNFIAGSFSYVGRGTDNGGRVFATPRYTPYHVPHSTMIAGFMTILHGDARFCNNVFVQKPVREDLMMQFENKKVPSMRMYDLTCGTIAYDDYPLAEEYFAQFKTRPSGRDAYYDHLPVYFEGNYYFNGAVACSKEKDAYVDTRHQVMFRVLDQGNECVFTTNVFAFLPRGEKRLLTSNELGMAFEPEQRFENTDGSVIVFDTDIIGNHRSIRPTAGPFEVPAERYVLFRTGSYRNPVLIEGVRPAIPQNVKASDYKNAGNLVLDNAVSDYKGVDNTVSENKGSGYNTSGNKGSGYNTSDNKASGNSNSDNKISFDEALEDASNEGITDVEDGDMFESSDESSRDRKKNLHCQIALVDCESISVTSKEQVRQVSEIFIEDNTAWVHLEGDSGITEIDCAYGICHYIPSWSMEAEDTVSVQRSDGTMALGRCIAALLRIYIDKDLQDPDIMEERVSAAEGPVLNHYGIQLRFAKRQLKLVKNKKFLTLMQAAEAVRRASGDVIVDELQ